MSSTFDTMQQTLKFLVDRIPDDVRTGQVEDAYQYLMLAIDALHSFSHGHDDCLNRGRAGVEAEKLRTVLMHEDDEERATWLRLKDGGKL